MRLDTLEIENFLSVGARITLNLRKRGLVGVEGDNKDDPSATSNGSGKTTVFIDAPSWCLWGETTRGYEGDDVINLKARKDCLVTLYMRVHKQTIVVSRARGHSKYKNQLRLEIDGLDETKSSIKETQAEIERLLGMNAQTFLNSVMFGATPGYRFSALTDKQQKEVFDDALGIAQYAAAYDLAHKERAVLTVTCDTHRAVHANAESAQIAAHKRLAELQSKAASFDAEKEEALTKLRERRDKTTERIRKAELELTTTGRKDVETQEELLSELQKARNYITAKIGEWYAKEMQINKEIKRVVKSKEDAASRVDYTCEECGSEVTEDTRDTHLASLEEKHTTLAVKLKDIKRKQHELNIELTNENTRVDEATAIRDTLRITQVENINLRNIIKSKERERTELKEEIAKLKDKESPYRSLIKKCQREIAEHAVIEVEEATHIKRCEKEIEQLDFWAEAFGTKGLRSYLIDTALPYLNERAEYYAQTLTDGSVEIEFKTQSKLKGGATVEKFEVAVHNKFGADKYKGNSGGEKAKVDLCVGLALQDLVMSRSATRTNVAFFDEIFDKMDEAGVERAVNVLIDVAKQRESIFVVTHLDALKSYFPSTVIVVKRKKVTKLEE